MQKLLLLSLLFFSFLFAPAQTTFTVGDLVEVFSAGEAKHGVVVGGYQDSEFGYGTYQVHLDGEKYCNNHTLDSRIQAKFVQPRFQPNAAKRFAAGESVEVRRYDGAVYKGQVLGYDGDKYEVRYNWNGTPSTEWFHPLNIRTASAGQTSETPTAKHKALPGPKEPAGPSPAGLRFNVGDRVLYDDLGFLVTKRYGIIVSVDPEKRQYTIRDEKDPSWRYTYNCYQVLRPNEKPNNNFFIGKWEVHLTGATSTFVKDRDLYRRFSGGMKLPPLEIKADGTYSWVLPNNKVIRGSWKPREGVPGITLLKALDGLDYTLYEKTEGFATTKTTRDEIGLHHLPSSTGYYIAYRIGANKSCVLSGRVFQK